MGDSASRKKYIVFALTFALALIADQGSKMWARAALSHPYRVINVIDGFWEFRYSENPGSAFSLFTGVTGARYILLVVGVGALFVVASLLRKISADALRVAAELGLLAGGAIGNMIDRVVHGVVTDFVRWKYHQYAWPTFNVADAALVLGILGLFFHLKTPPKEPATSPSPKSRRRSIQKT